MPRSYSYKGKVIDREVPDDVVHGKRSTYVYYRCHCPPCVEANREYNKMYDRRVRRATKLY